jgi:hypothetical protein
MTLLLAAQDSRKEKGRRRDHVAGQCGRIRGIWVGVGEPPGGAVQGETKRRRSFAKSITQARRIAVPFASAGVLKARSVMQRFADAPAAFQITQHGFG